MRFSPGEAENIKHDRYFAHHLAWNFAHEKCSAHDSYQLSQQARVAVSSADSSRVSRDFKSTKQNGLELFWVGC